LNLAHFRTEINGLAKKKVTLAGTLLQTKRDLIWLVWPPEWWLFDLH